MAKHNAAVMLITPAVILAVCGGIIAGAGYVPVQKESRSRFNFFR